PRHLLVHHRRPRPRRLRRPHDLPPPEQLLAGPEQRMVETPLARQNVHEPEIDAVHRHRAGDLLQRREPAHLAEPPARVRLLHQQLERHPPRRAPVPPPLLGQPAEIRLLIFHPHPPPPE